MTSLQKEVAGLLLSDTQPERVFSNKVLPSIAEIIAHSNGNEDLNDAYYLIASNCIDHLACNGVDDKDKEELLDTLKTEAEQAKVFFLNFYDDINSKEKEQLFIKSLNTVFKHYKRSATKEGKFYIGNDQIDAFTKEIKALFANLYGIKIDGRAYNKIVSILSSDKFCFSGDWLTNAFQTAYFN